jgi:hypothetical protein
VDFPRPAVGLALLPSIPTVTTYKVGSPPGVILSSSFCCSRIHFRESLASSVFPHRPVILLALKVCGCGGGAVALACVGTPRELKIAESEYLMFARMKDVFPFLPRRRLWQSYFYYVSYNSITESSSGVTI